MVVVVVVGGGGGLSKGKSPSVGQVWIIFGTK